MPVSQDNCWDKKKYRWFFAGQLVSGVVVVVGGEGAFMFIVRQRSQGDGGNMGRTRMVYRKGDWRALGWYAGASIHVVTISMHRTVTGCIVI